MKGLKKLALATAVAAAPFAQADLVAMDDEVLADMTGQAGITIDVDLQLTIDAIKYVDSDGATRGAYDLNGDGDTDDAGENAVVGGQGAITATGIKVGSIDSVGDLSTARIRGVTIDADGSQGLTIGLGQIGGLADGHTGAVTADDVSGIDISVDAILINAGQANLAKYDLTQEIATSTDVGTAAANAVAAGAYADAAAYAAGLSAGEAAAIGHLAAVDSSVQDAIDYAAEGAAGNVGGVIIEDFRNYIEDDLVNKYNGVFDMALMDSTGAIVGDAAGGGDQGRFVRGEIQISGTGTYDTSGNGNHTGGLKIAGTFGGALDKAAWVDGDGTGASNEFGVQDLGFFHAVDTNSDGISDTIEGMHFEMNIDVVERASSVETGVNVSALAISDMKLEGTIMMGDIYLGGTNTADRSLGSVLVKDIDMTGTTVYIYGH